MLSFSRICSWGARKVASAARRVAVCVFMVGSFSDHSRIAHCGNATSTIFPKYLSDLGVQFCVAGAAFGEVHVSLFAAGAAFGEVHV